MQVSEDDLAFHYRRVKPLKPPRRSKRSSSDRSLAAAYASTRAAARGGACALCAIEISNCRSNNRGFPRFRCAHSHGRRAAGTFSCSLPAIARRRFAELTRSKTPVNRRSRLPISHRGTLSSSLIRVSSSSEAMTGFFPAEAHQHHIGGEPVQPRGKRRLASKSMDLAEELEKRLLRQILRFHRVSQHAQTE